MPHDFVFIFAYDCLQTMKVIESAEVFTALRGVPSKKRLKNS